MLSQRFTRLRLLGAALLLLGLIACGGTDDPAPETFTLTVAVTGSGSGTVTSVPGGIDVTKGDAPDSAEYDDGDAVTLTAVAAGGSSFTGWTGACTGSDLTCVVTMDADASVTATFDLIDPDPQTLTVNRAGSGDGSVTSVPGGIILAAGAASGSAEFPINTSVQLVAAPVSGSFFTGWSGACTGLTCTVTMSVARTVTASFALVSEGVTEAFEILAASDDAEQYLGATPFGPTGSTDIGSSTLELGQHPDLLVNVIVGLRYGDISVPRGAVITAASITFTRRIGDSSAGAITVRLRGEASDDSSTFVSDTTGAGLITGRATTTASVTWPIVSPWGTTATTPDLAAIVQEIVDRPGWTGGSALAFIIDGEGDGPDNVRRAQAFGTGRTPPQLSITYYVPAAP